MKEGKAGRKVKSWDKTWGNLEALQNAYEYYIQKSCVEAQIIDTSSLKVNELVQVINI